MQREKKKEMIKQRIIESTLKTMESSSFDGMTVNRICMDAGVSKKTLYSYYKSKEELYLDLVHLSFLALNECFIDALKQEKDQIQELTVIDQVLVLGKTYLQFIVDNKVKGKIVTEFQEPDYVVLYEDKVRAISFVANQFELNAFLAAKNQAEVFTPSLVLSLWASVQGIATLLVYKKEWIVDYYGLTVHEIVEQHISQIRDYIEFVLRVKQKGE